MQYSISYVFFACNVLLYQQKKLAYLIEIRNRILNIGYEQVLLQEMQTLSNYLDCKKGNKILTLNTVKNC